MFQLSALSTWFTGRRQMSLIEKLIVILVCFVACLSILVFGRATSLAVDHVPSERTDIHRPLIVGYLDEGRLTKQTIKRLDQNGTAKRLTHIMYAFGQVKDGVPILENEQTALHERYDSDESVDGNPDATSGDQALCGALNQLRKLKLRHPHLKLLLSIGGGDTAQAKGFSAATRSPQLIARFVQVAIDRFIKGNIGDGISAKGLFDGFDIDWEYPTDCREGCVPEDKANFTLLLRELRHRLDEQSGKDGMRYELTIAGSAWVDDYEKYEWQRIHPLLDFINVMTYWAAPGNTRPISPLYKSSNETGRWSDTFNTDYAVTRYLKEGVPANKIVIGVPFFGRGWEGVPNVNNGMFQKPSKLTPGSWGDGEESYNKLKKLKGFRLFRDSEIQALWIFNPTTGVFWSFDDRRSLSVKMNYAKEHSLGGVMFWELNGDDEKGSLVKALYRGLHRSKIH
jgi:chitinase